ncbi:MAG: hypothetical protein AAFR54_11485 [Planctomycetota bacterium]
MARHVAFVAPFALESTLRFVQALARLEGVRLAVLTQEPAGRLEARLGVPGVVVERIGDAHDPAQLEAGVRAASAALGGRIDVLSAILEPLQVPLAQVRERLGIRGMDAAEARRFRDKAHMKDVLRENDLPCARHVLARSRDEALAFARDVLPLVAKPPAGAGARDTFRVEEISELERWMAQSPPSAARPLLLEEFVQGEEFSFDSITVGGEHVLHSINEYTPTPLQVMETPWIQWTVLSPRELDDAAYADIHAAGPRALDALGMVTGITHMEWFRRGDGSIAISEVAARPPGAQFTSLLSYVYDLDMYKAWAELTAFERFEAPPRKYAAGAAYLRGQERGGGAGRVAQVRGLEQARDELGDLVCEAKIPQPGQPRAESYEGEGYLILRDENTDRVRDGLRRAVEILQVDLA